MIIVDTISNRFTFHDTSPILLYKAEPRTHGDDADTYCWIFADELEVGDIIQEFTIDKGFVGHRIEGVSRA